MDYVDFHGYKVYRDGRVFNKKGKEIKPILMDTGYTYSCLCFDRKVERWLRHRLVATCFIPNPENLPLVNHINAIKTDNRVENLEWTDKSGNALHAVSMGLWFDNNGTKNKNSKLSEPEVKYMRIICNDGMHYGAYSKFARLLDVDAGVVRRAVIGESYKNIE